VTKLQILNREIVACELCPRLRDHGREVARVKRRAYRDWDYWGKPVPSFGDPKARVLIVGLAPGAHGSNRTGRMFTGDKSGDILFWALHANGFASQVESSSSADGLVLKDLWITAAAHCAPPDNKPLPEEFAACQPFLKRELAILRPQLRVVVALGKLAADAYLGILKDQGEIASRAPYGFGHGVEHALGPTLLCSYHPSQQNTSTGRLTREMLWAIFARARALAG